MPGNLGATLVAGRQVRRGRVNAADRSGLWVEIEDEEIVPCDILVGSPGEALRLQPGDPVLVMLPTSERERACVLGVITRYAPQERNLLSPDVETLKASEIVIEAGKRLELRVGMGRVTITEDGRICIEGQHLLSSAKALNRIRGAAVKIN